MPISSIAYLDCPSGVSGDMLLGALLDAGLSLEALRAVLATLPLRGYTLIAEPVRRGALGATLARVRLEGEEQSQRGLGDILALIAASALPDPVRAAATRVFRRLAEAEARVHRMTLQEVHFHEVGAVDAIVDIVGVCAGLHLLGITEVYASPLPMGRGSVKTAHGTLPLPAPAVLELLAEAGAPSVPHPSALELVTPTGAALLTTLARFEQPPLRLSRVGYGAGSRAEPAPNLLRLWLGEPHVAQPATAPGLSTHDQAHVEPDGGPIAEREAEQISGLEAERLLVLEANIDDMPGELFGHAMERLLEAGALDAWCAPLTMKKSRPGVLLAALCRPERRAALVDVFLRQTSTFGVRARAVTRYAAAREVRQVETPYGTIAVKLKLLDGAIVGAAPEYEDCRRLAAACNVPLPQVYAAALAAVAPLLQLE